MNEDNIILQALKEDIGNGDITTNSTIPEGKKASFKLIAKEDFVVCGVKIFEKAMNIFDSSTKIKHNAKDGDFINKGAIILEGIGNARSILTAERVALNLMQYMSAIATKTKTYTEILKGTDIKILDTRKTIPLYRELSKYAVKIGGGENHRFGLYDQILIKDNHIEASGSIKSAVRNAKKLNIGRKIVIECENKQQINESLNENVDRIMLDNMSNKEISDSIKLIDGRCKIEVSGNMNLKRIEQLKDYKIDFISVGAITHTISFVDISLKVF